MTENGLNEEPHKHGHM